MDFLKEVILEKQRFLKESKRRYPEEELRLKLEEPRVYRPFKDAISRSGKLNIIAELKKASPSAGLLREHFDPLQIARAYENSGAAAVSILTEEKYFQGKIAYLNQVRKIINLPILRKDFIFDKYQLYESKFFGADAVLLIAEILKDGKLAEFLETARRLELDCLVEVNSEEDLKYALVQGAQIIGINNRNLHTLEVGKLSFKDLLKCVPQGIVAVMESGIKTRRDYLRYEKLEVSAVLIGTAFIASEDISDKFKELTQPSAAEMQEKKAKSKKTKAPVSKLKAKVKTKTKAKIKTKIKTGIKKSRVKRKVKP